MRREINHMRTWAVLAENKLGDWIVYGIFDNEEDAQNAVQCAWVAQDKYGYSIYHSVQVFERWAA